MGQDKGDGIFPTYVDSTQPLSGVGYGYTCIRPGQHSVFPSPEALSLNKDHKYLNSFPDACWNVR
ncbi:hypothetical protein E2C01_011898 [Portunus trituberculatus]|uniref:Uncharacterized protein n=1 Tax=Portunus trituberculatus TaxID=210409 RepID=A0A5B7DD68_PORTR|nr:hypothetical protein [Portunus trituberculatus]